MPLILSNKYSNKLSKESNKFIPLEFEHSNGLLAKQDVNLNINAAELYQRERDSSTCYRITANLSLIASNVLFNITGETSYETIQELRNYDVDDDVYEFTEAEILKRENGWWWYLTGETLTPCERVYLEPVPDKLSLLNHTGDTNWGMWLTYPETSTDTLEFDGVPIGDGLRVNTMSQVGFNNRTVIKVITAIPHALTASDEVRVINSTTSAVDSYVVYKIGDENGDYPANAFLIDANFTPPDVVAELVSIKHTLNGTDSQYHCRWFTKLTQLGDYNIYPTSLSRSIFDDSNQMVTFEKDINTSGLTDYLGRPVSELYLSIVKSPWYVVPNEDFWTPVVAGIETIFAYSQYDINTITGTGIEYVNTTGDVFFGDIVEWNPLSQTEVVLAQAQHRFNSNNRTTNGYLEGYWYQPHYRIPIKTYYDRVTESTDTTIIPDWASEIDGKSYWREQKPNSIVNDAIGFLNGCHYVWDNFTVYLKRQDPCGEYDLGLYVVLGDCETFDGEFKPDDETC